jgi:hypothetical protein
MQVSSSFLTGTKKLSEVPKDKTNVSNTSTTFAGCYSVHKIQEKQICLVFDRGFVY